jgi:hypothetical protein
MAVITPSGTEIREATAVTDMEAMMRGKMPKRPGSDVGYHNRPKMKSVMETRLKMGIPSMKRNSMMRESVMIEAEPIVKKQSRIPFSVLLRRAPPA